MTTNGGSSWRQLTPGSPALPNRAITAIAVHPSNPYKIYVHWAVRVLPMFGAARTRWRTRRSG
jgi:hypothetical protein